MTDSIASVDARYRYWAFISYSHKDEAWAKWLHKGIETYAGHRKLVGSENRFGEPVPRRMFPVFRDRDELEGAPDLPGRINDALQQARFLIVICSPSATASQWVDAEIRKFKSLGREDRVLAVIVDGEPNSTDSGDSEHECFPKMIRYRLDDQGQVGSVRAEPIAADARKGKDGERLALLKIAAAILGVRFDELRRRDAERRRKRLIAGSIAAVLLLSIVSGLVTYGIQQRNHAAERALVARSGQLVVKANALASSRFDLALLLAIEAQAVSSTVEARRALWNLLAMQPRLDRFLAPEGQAMVAAAFDVTGRNAVTAYEGGGVDVWDLKDDRKVRSLQGTGQSVALVAFAGQDLIAAITSDDELILWDAAGTGTMFPLTTDGAALTGARFATAQPWLASVDEQGNVALWDMAKRPPVRRVLGSVHPGTGDMGFSENDQRLSILDHEGPSVITFNLVTFEKAEHIPIRDPGLRISAAEFAPDGSTVATVDVDVNLMMWNPKNGYRKSQPLQLPGLVTALRFSNDGNTLALGLNSGIVRLIDSSGSFTGTLQTGASEVTSLTFNSNGTSLLSGNKAGALARWNTGYSSQSQLKRLLSPCKNSNARRISVSTDGAWLGSGCDAGTVVSSALIKGDQAPRTVDSGSEMISSIALGSDGTTALIVSEKGLLGRVSFSPGSVEWTEPEDGDRFVSAATSGNGKLLAAVSLKGQLMLWDPASASRRSARIQPSSEQLQSIALDFEGRTVAVTSDRGHLAAGAVASGITNVRQLPGSVDPNIAVGFSPDGHTIVGVSGEHKVLAWSLSTTEAQPMELLPDVVDIAALGPDGRWLVIDRSGMLQFFQWPSLTLVAEDEGRSIKDLALAGDGGTVAAGYRTSGVAVWNLEEHEWVRRACRIANRDLTTEEIQTHLGQTAPLLRCADLLAGPVANTR